ncbi:MAG: outer membrane lipoprotein carrier protein LolA [Salaquimonas sp.]|jgi:outer membrane lipoprotein-sorting protein|nr:outer membrane lipoprotein carrier protein LolA [Salaquimonas sp.]
MKISTLPWNWRQIPGIAVAFLVVATFLVAPADAQAKPQKAALTNEQTVEALSQHFAAVPTMTGEFLQFGPNGSQTGGTFYISRPGKIRFNYEQTAPVEVISNGTTVAVHNKKLKTWDFYPLEKTPLKLLLSNRIEFDDHNIKSVVNEPDLTTIVMGDDKVFGDALITLMFDPETFDLRQWTVKDSKGAETSVMVFNVEKNVELPDRLFKFDELAIQRRLQQQRNSNR